MAGEVERLIEAARAEGASIVDLSGQELTEVPESVRTLTAMTALGLHNNRLSQVPAWLCDLTRLTVLSLGHNQLTELPPALGDLTALDALHLQHNQLTGVPDSLSNLTALTELHLEGNRLTRLPESLGRLTALVHLDASENRLTRLPASLGHLAALEYLDISDNELTDLPESLAGLAALTGLTLGANHFARLPRWLADLALTECDFDRSEIDVSEISDVWFRSTLSLEEIATGLSAQDAERDEENYWEWIIAAFAGVHIDITRPRPEIAAPGDADTRVFRWGGSSRFFPEHTVRELVAGLRRIGVDPVHAGRWSYRGGEDFDKEID
jgi:Leucine-rich repeat (LRR) protein